MAQVDEGTGLWDEVSSFRSIQESWSSTPIKKKKTIRLAHLILLFCAIHKMDCVMKTGTAFSSEFTAH